MYYRKLKIKSIEELLVKKDLRLISEKPLDKGIEIKYKCLKCGTINYKSLDCLVQIKYKFCNKCSVQKSPRKRMYSWQFVKNTFKERNFTLLSTSAEYKDSNSFLHFRCHCGGKSRTKLSHLLNYNAVKCRHCPAENRLSIEKVRKIFAEKGLKLLSKTYRNNREKLRYECKCGLVFSSPVQKIQLFKFKNCYMCVFYAQKEND